MLRQESTELSWGSTEGDVELGNKLTNGSGICVIGPPVREWEALKELEFTSPKASPLGQKLKLLFMVNMCSRQAFLEEKEKKNSFQHHVINQT